MLGFEDGIRFRLGVLATDAALGAVGVVIAGMFVLGYIVLTRVSGRRRF